MFQTGDKVQIDGTVIRVRDEKVELQTRDGQLVRVPIQDAKKVEVKAVTQSENKAINPKENKSKK